jgi:hypothetical protein
MTKDQGNILLWGVVAVVASVVYPPWLTSFAVEPASLVVERKAQTNREMSASSHLVSGTDEYGWLWAPPNGHWNYGSQTPTLGVRPDVTRLAMEWLAIAAVFGSLYWASPRTIGQPTASRVQPDQSGE